jgi:phosphotransferase system enzyme I (PtsI)
MHPSQILQVRDRLGSLSHAHMRRCGPRLIRAHTHEQVAALLEEMTG